MIVQVDAEGIVEVGPLRREQGDLTRVRRRRAEVILTGWRVARALLLHVPLTIDQLTRREREVVQQISKGHTNRQIAANLGMAERTVDSHVGNIRQKLQLPSRAQIAVWAVANGLSRPD